MTVASTGLRKEYTGNGVATSFAYDWKISNKAHLLVTRVTIADDTETTLTVDTDYTVSGVANPSGGTVIPTVLLSSAYRLVITSNVPAEQQTGFTNQNTVPPQTVEDAMDKLTIIVKQMLETLSRAVTVSVGSDLSPTDYIAELEDLLAQAQAAQSAAAASQSSASSSAATATAQAVISTDQAAISTAQAVLAAASAAQFQGTSTTSITVGTGSKVFTTQAGKLFHGEYVQVYSAADPTKFMNGICTYSGTTLTVTVDSIGAAGGPFTDWVIKVSGAKGATGSTGATGPTGATGTPIAIASAGGTVDAITADFSPDITLTDKQLCIVISAGANTSTTPTFSPDGLTARTIVKNGGQALAAGNTGAAGYPMLLEYNLANTRWELMNPVVSSSGGGQTLAYEKATGQYYWVFGGSSGTVTVTAGRVYYIPVIIPTTRTVTDLVANVTTLAAGNLRMGLYTDSGGVPSSLVYTAGTASTGTTGYKHINNSQSVTAGLYWIALQFDATPTLERIGNEANVVGGGFGATILGSNNPPVQSGSGVGRSYYQTQAYASGLPATASSLTLVTGNTMPAASVYCG